jgi:hypothetical protein
MAKNWTMAGKSFCQAAEIQLKQNTKHEAANMYNEAANSFKKASPEEALNCLNKSCEIYIDMVFIYCITLTYVLKSQLNLIFIHNTIICISAGGIKLCFEMNEILNKNFP